MIKNTLASPNRESHNRQPSGVTLALIAILLLAAAFRLAGLDWDQGQHLHPDERFLSMVISGLEPASSVGDYFDTPSSPLNPNNRGYGFFVYGDFPITLVFYVSHALGMSTYFDAYLVGRVLSAIADVFAILLLFFTGKRLFDARVGLLASALYAAAALPIQLSHFFAVDTFTSFFVVAAFLFAGSALKRHRWIDDILFGLMLGLAMASKVSVYPLAAILILAVALRETRQPFDQQRLIHSALGVVLAGAVTVLAFRLAQPYAFLPPGSDVPMPEGTGTLSTLVYRAADLVGMRPNPTWMDQMREVRRQVSGYADIPPNHQWGFRPALIFPWVNMARVGLGWPLGVFAWLAWLWAVWEIVRRHPGWQELALPVAWVGLFFTWQGIGWVKTMRYFLPVYPFLLLLAGWALLTAWDRVQALIRARRAPRWHWSAKVAAGLAAFVVASGTLWGFAVSQIYTRPVTRVAASEWIYENIPGDVTLFIETESGPRQYQLGLPNTWLPPDQVEDDPARPAMRFTRLDGGAPQYYDFTPPFGGTLTGIRLNHVVDVDGLSDEKTLHVAITTRDRGTILAEGTIAGAFPATDDPRGGGYNISFEPIAVEANQPYSLLLEVDGLHSLQLAGATVATEGAWDDPLPLPLAGYNAWDALYQGYELQIHWDDLETKRDLMLYVLDRADYIVISSNRFYDSLRRNPARWPMTMAYYEALFSGDLGFELVGDFTSRPSLGPIEFVDDDAEEAWTVYDHPRALIFQRTPAYDPGFTAHLLDQFDLESFQHFILARDAIERPITLPSPENARHIEEATTTAETLPPDFPARHDIWSRCQPLTVAVWWGALTLAGWAVFPILYTLFPGLPDRGYGVTRVFALVATAWGAWIASSTGLATWTGVTVIVSLLAWTTLAAALAWPRREELRRWLRENRRHVVLVEGLALALFLFFVLVRLGNPDVWHPAYGGEKPMELAYFNAVLRSETFPPYDPWFEGGTLNYYYYGFVIVGALVKVLGVPLTLAFNLIIPMVFSLTGIGAFSAAFNLMARAIDDGPREATHRSLWETLKAWPQVTLNDVLGALNFPRLQIPHLAGFMALLITVILGNLDEIRTIIWGLHELGAGGPTYITTLMPNDFGLVLDGLRIALQEGQPLPVGLGEWYWNATRLIPVPLNELGIPAEVQPITEFPFFTFLYADLHPHMIAMPLGLLALNWAIAQIKTARQEIRLGTWLSGLNGLVGALAIGTLRPANTWDWPTYLALGIGALGLAHFIRRKRFDTTTLIGILWRGAALALAGMVLFLPFLQHYRLVYNSASLWTGSKTPIWAYLDIHGLQLFIIVSFMAAETLDWVRTLSRRGILPAVGLIAATTAISVVLAAKGYPVAVVAVPLIVWALTLFFRHDQEPEKRAVFAMVTVALALTLVVEIVVLAGDISRMNTVFKFYLQVWLLLSVAAGASLGWLWPRLLRTRELVRTPWAVALGVLIGLAGLYPLLATRGKVIDRMAPDTPTTLDGMAFMQYAERGENGVYFSLEPDYMALRWLQDNVEEPAVVLEAHTIEYQWGNRVSIYTGLPAVVGWNWHQRQQRPWQSEEVTARVENVAELYNTTDTTLAMSLLEAYNVTYIMVGNLERAYYTPEGLEKFVHMAEAGYLSVVYDVEGTMIYRVEH
jgi:YYY domain-containing protein